MTERQQKVRQLYEDLAKRHYASGILAWNVDKIGSSFDNRLLTDIVDSARPCGQNAVEYDSPWEAAIYLYEKQARNGYIEGDTTFNQGQNITVERFKTVFRGQNADHKTIYPTQWRQNKIKPERLHLWQACFGFLLKEVTEASTDTNLQAMIYMAAAQHYHIPTELLDFTVDAAIAVSFPHPGSPGDRGVVLFVDLELEDQAEIMLPPPFVTRLYKQRGLFHFTTDKQKNEALYDRCGKVYFPLDPSFELPLAYPFKKAELEASDSLFEELYDLSKSIAEDPSTPIDLFTWMDAPISVQDLGPARKKTLSVVQTVLDALKAKHHFSSHDWNKLKAAWIDQISDYIGWLAMFESASGQHLTAMTTIARAIERNRDGLYLYANALLEAADANQLGNRRDFLLRLREALEQRYPELIKRRAWYVVNGTLGPRIVKSAI